MRKLLFLYLLLSLSIVAQQSDNLNGTFTNPVLWADFPDPDAIRVDDTYYMVSTSMHYFPGVTVLASMDLVNWQIASNAVQEFNVHPFYNLDGGDRYAGGQWASSIRYHHGKYYVLFNTNAEGGFMCISDSAEGPWQLKKLSGSYYDPGLFIDNDHRMYIVHGYTNIYVTELDPVDLSVKTPSILIHSGSRNGLEGNHCYHIGDYYYIYCTYGGAQGTQMCLRSSNIYGPYEEREILNNDANLTGMGLHQACLLDTPEGDYWSLIFQDRRGLGRIPFLLPVKWIDGWPLIAPDSNGMVTFSKPVVDESLPVTPFPTSDEFGANILAKQWQFNHNGDKTKYSLTERSGYLRLKSATLTTQLKSARNTLCQRIFGPIAVATTEIDLSNMMIGDVAGLCILQDPHASIVVKKNQEGWALQMRRNDSPLSEIEWNQPLVYLRAHVNAVTDRVHFFYSKDNEDFHLLGDEFKMEFNLTVFCGNRFGLLNYAEQQLGGYVDVNWFRVDGKSGAMNYRIASEQVEAEMYDNIHGGKMASSTENILYYNQDVSFKNSGWVSFDQLDFLSDQFDEFSVRYMVRESNAKLTLRMDSLNGEVLQEFILPRSASRRTFVGKLKRTIPKGVRKIVLQIEKSGLQLLLIDWFQFSESTHSSIAGNVKTVSPRIYVQEGFLNIWGACNVETVDIYCTAGTKKISSFESRVDVSSLQPGIYIVQINKKDTFKLIIEK